MNIVTLDMGILSVCAYRLFSVKVSDQSGPPNDTSINNTPDMPSSWYLTVLHGYKAEGTLEEPPALVKVNR